MAHPIRRSRSLIATATAVVAFTACSASAGIEDAGTFNRLAAFPVYLNTSVEAETAPEIISATEDGMTLVYSDSPGRSIGFIDIADPANPVAGGAILVDGEPTCVAIFGNTALVPINTSPSFVKPSGLLYVIDVPTRKVRRIIPLGGQPDSIAISPDRQYAAIAIENERDEDLGDGAPPQMPAGFLTIVDLLGGEDGFDSWTTRDVELTGLPILYPTDPEPESVEVNADNQAVLSLQENNAFAIIDLASGAIERAVSAGAVDLEQIDTVRNSLITQVFSQPGRLREPDAVAWIGTSHFASANEGDLDGGSRNFTIFNSRGEVAYDDASNFEHLAAAIGHYPERRSNSKGTEPEATIFATYGEGDEALDLLFVASERGSFIAVYEIDADLPCPGDLDGDGSVAAQDLSLLLSFWGACPPFGEPCPADLDGNGLVDAFDMTMLAANWGTCPVDVEFRQVLPSGFRPEGLLAIPQRNLLVVASEVDDRGGAVRGTVTIYEMDDPTYPQIASETMASGTPIPWGALSGLAASPDDSDTVLTIYDSFYRKSRLFAMDVTCDPAIIFADIPLVDTNGVLLAALEAIKAQLPDTPGFVPASFVDAELNVNLDPEGIAVAVEDAVWLASEGAGNLVDGVSNPGDQPFRSPNLLVRVGDGGVIEQVVSLPIELVRNQLRFGFEGVASVEEGGVEILYVCFQRSWTAAGDPSDKARIGRYDTATGEWTFAHYPLDTPTSPNGGWVGLSEIVSLGNGRFAVIERDNQAGPDATIKRLASFSIDDVVFRRASELANFDTLVKQLDRDLIADGDYQAGVILEKIEGLAVLPGGEALVVTDNDGVNDSSGETQLIRIPGLYPGGK